MKEHLGDEDTKQSLLAAGVHSMGPIQFPRETHLNRLTLTWFAFYDTEEAMNLEISRLRLIASHRSGGLIAVSIHWGTELSPVPNTRQRFIAEMLAEAGADIIIGHHPHVLQPVEWIWGSGRGRRTLVAYSMGNTIFDQGAPPGSRYGALLLVKAGRAGIGSVCAGPIQVDPRTWSLNPAGPNAKEAISRSLDLTCILPPTCE